MKFRQIPPRCLYKSLTINRSTESQSLELFEWLADHTYEEVVELVAAEPPLGFGIKVGKTTLCRFYKAHFYEIDDLRQKGLMSRSSEMLGRDRDQDYRYVLRASSEQLLLERLFELLSRPVQSADELKKLAAIAEKMKSLDTDKEDEMQTLLQTLSSPSNRPRP